MAVSLARLPFPLDEAATDPAEEQSVGELVAALVRQNDSPREARARAGNVLDLAGSAWGLARLGRNELLTAGLSDDSIHRLRAALALGARVATARAPMRPMDAESVAAMLRPLLRHLPHEELHVVLLDARNRYLSRRRVAAGGVAACSVYAKDILAPAVERRAPAIVVVHNHPSGDPSPSLDDIALTMRLATACDTVGVRLVDHLVVADDGFQSVVPDLRRWETRRDK